MMSRVNHPPRISLHAADDGDVALCSAVDIAAGAEAPEWIHLLPAGDRIFTVDGRGPYLVSTHADIIAASLPTGERLVLDENHATDHAAPRGEPAPARGWIVGLEAREDGIWGQVEWTAAGRRLVASRAYRAISPAVLHDKAGKVQRILRASLVNRANLRNLKTLHQESTMNPLLQRLLKALGLEDSTSEDTLVAAVTTLHQQHKTGTVSLQAQLDPIAVAAGLTAGATSDQVIAAIGALGGTEGKSIVALQSELANVAGQLTTLRADVARDKATDFIDGAIRDGRVGVKPLRDHYITRHMADAVAVEKEIGALPKLAGGSIVPTTQSTTQDGVSLNAEESAVARQLGLDPKAMGQSRDQLAGQVATL
jgi:phage I-like protein